MHILFLTDNFPPEVNAPASRTHEHCRRWVQAGHRVTVITCVPNFPTGKVFDGWRNKPWQTSEVDEIRVIRVWSYITANEGFLRRVLDYLSYMFTATLASLFVRRVDVVVGTSPQFFTAVAGWAVGAMKRVPFVFELRDLWPESIKAVGAMSNLRVLGVIEKLELFLYRRAARIVSVTHSFRRTLGLRGIDVDKIAVVTNGVDIARFTPRQKDEGVLRALGLQDRFVAGYIGTHGMAHGLDTLLRAAAILKSRPEAARICLLLLGDGARKAELQAEARRLDLDNVVFVDSVPKHQVVNFWSVLDVSIIHLRRTELFTTVIPSKMFECMGMGIPILHGVAGESADIVRREGVGCIFEPESAGELADQLLRMMNDPSALAGYRARCLDSARHYDRSMLADKMLAVIASAIPGTERPRTNT